MNEKPSTWRYMAIGVAISVLPVLIILQLVRIRVDPNQVKQIQSYIPKYEGAVATVKPVRGVIYDRWGHLMAANKTVYEVGLELKDIENPETVAMTLSIVLGKDYKEVFALASMKASATAVYVPVSQNATQAQVDQLMEMKSRMADDYYKSKDANPQSLRGVVYSPKLARSYPEKAVGSNLLGFVNDAGEGYFGIEGKYNNLLAGKTRQVFYPNDPTRVEEMPSLPEGASLILTIDREVQSAIEQVLDSSIAETGSDSGTIVVLQPKTGELIAMATTPRLDLNNYAQYFNLFNNETPYNRGVGEAYEPGSVFKVLTMATALDTGAVKPETSFLDTGAFEIGGTYIYNWNGGAWGPQDMQGCMQHSLNVCLAWIASQTGAKNFYQYMNAFGIGKQTGVDLAGEAYGRLKIPGDADWYEADLGTNSFGQGVSATPIQMATAISAIANDGKMMVPHIVRSLVNNGYQYNIEPRVLGAPVRPDTAHTLSEMLARSLELEASDALVEGYRVAGKTGTAEIPTPYGYTSSQTNASFVGWGPVDDPQFLVYVWLEKPSISPWGSVVASPVFRQVVEKLVVLLNIPPDDVRHQMRSQ